MTPFPRGSWRGQCWIPRAAQEFDGWIVYGVRTNFAAIEGIQRYRDAGGKRAIVTNLVVDLDAPTTRLDDHEPFHLRCAPEAAAERLQRLAELGFDDAVLVLRQHSEAQVNAARALYSPEAG